MQNQESEVVSLIKSGGRARELVSISSPCLVKKCHHRDGRSEHCHNCFEIFYVLSGSAEHQLELPGKAPTQQSLAPGSYAILDPKAVHSFLRPSQDFHLLNLLFLPKLVEPSYPDDTELKTLLSHPLFGFPTDALDYPFVNQICTDQSGQILHLLEKCWKAYTERDFCCQSLIRCYVSVVFILTAKRWVPGYSDGRKSHVISYICNYINANYGEDISLSKICKAQYLNTSFISRKFKESMGMNFEAYLQKARIQNACTRLIETDLSVEEISAAVGYGDPGSFRKVFRRIVGVSPTEFRKRNQ